MKQKLHFKSALQILLILLISTYTLQAQIIINAPIPADNPNLSGNSPWDAICAGNGGFNQYYANITWVGSVNPDNEFILELSDATGSFDNNPTQLATTNTHNSNNNFDLEFAIPTTSRGTGYKMRVRSTDPEKISVESEAYNMYYMDVTTSINISETGNGTPPGSICNNKPITLQVDNIANPETYQYIWNRSGTPLPDTGHTITATQTGMYYALIDYGPNCTGSGNTDSNWVDVTITNEPDITVTTTNATNLVLFPNQTETLEVSTNAISPTFQWFRNGNAISGATNNTIDITQDGDYYVVVLDTGGICSETIVNSETTTVIIPNSFEISIDNPAVNTACSSTSLILEVQTIHAIDTGGNKTDVTASLQDSFSYQWQKDGVDVAGATGKSISLTDISENGNYTVNGVLDNFNGTSESLAVQLLSNETLTINSTSTIYCNPTDIVTISTTKNITTRTFEWKLDGTTINTTDSSLNISSPGTYQLVIDNFGCPLISNEIVIGTLDPSIISLNVDGDIIFPQGGSETVTANGGTAYRWLDSNNIELATTDTYTFTEEGSYLLLANIDNCEITKTINVVYQELFNVPNVITPNGDGSNDQWVIPNSYANKSDINVVIYTDKGKEVWNVLGYQNDWPSSTTTLTDQNTVFYYIIRNANEILKQGTITSIR